MLGSHQIFKRTSFLTPVLALLAISVVKLWQLI